MTRLRSHRKYLNFHRTGPLLLYAAVLAGCLDQDDPALRQLDQEVIIERNARIATGHAHSCAVISGGVQCWGHNQLGQLGDGTAADSVTPVTVIGITTATAVTVGDNHSCAALADGTARCWGSGASGQLGDGSTTTRFAPVSVSGLAGVTSLSAGRAHTCASLAGGEVRCWGDNSSGALGNNLTVNASTPQAVVNQPMLSRSPVHLTGIVEIEAGAGSTCARTSSGTVSCWGANQYGQLGDGTYTQRRMPVTVIGVTGASDLGVGDTHACAVVSQRARCWGNNLFGQLGDGTQTTRVTAVEVRHRIAPDLTYPIINVSAVTAGAFHTCLRVDAALWCLGRNDRGQLARDITPYIEPLAVSSAPEIAVSEIAAGTDHTCVRLPHGQIMCFGDELLLGGFGRCPNLPTARVLAVAAVGLQGQPPTPPLPAQVLGKPGGLYYTNGDAVDVRVETSACAQVESVTVQNERVEPGAAVAGRSFEVLSTVDRPDGMRELNVRVRYNNVHAGASYPLSVVVAGPSGRTQKATATLSEVLEINRSSGTLDISRDEIFNLVLVAMYEKFGDGNYWTRNGMNFYAFDYGYLDVQLMSDGIWFRGKTKADLIPGTGDSNLCNPTSSVSGKFRVVLDGDQVATEWVDYPVLVTSWPLGCSIGTVLLADLVTLFVDEIFDNSLARKVEERIAKLRDYCTALNCDAVIDSVTHETGSVHVRLRRILDMESVTFNMPYGSTALDQPVGFPMRSGVAIPIGEPTMIVAGGVASACSTQVGACNVHSFGPAGLFNWSWDPFDPRFPDDEPHPPIPDPWPDCPLEQCPHYAGRQAPWERQMGLSRALSSVRLPASNVGAVIGKVIVDGEAAALGSAGEPCSAGSPTGTKARLVLGRNEVPTGGPYGGAFGTGSARVTLSWGDAAYLVGTCIPVPVAVPPDLEPEDPPTAP